MSGDAVVGIVSLALMGAILGDMLAHVAGTNAIFSGVGNVLGATYQAAAGSYSRAA